MANNFREVIPWYKLRLFLEQQIRVADKQIRHSHDDATIHRLQGRATVLEELLNLPETLEALEEEEDAS